jgi:hypothetical protein
VVLQCNQASRNKQGSQPQFDTASWGHTEMESKKVDLEWALVQEAQLKVVKRTVKLISYYIKIFK